MNTPRLHGIQRIVLLASFVFAFAIGLLWFRSLLVIDEMKYKPAIRPDGALPSAEWDFYSTNGALTISRFKQLSAAPIIQPSIEVFEVNQKVPGWSLNAASVTVKGDKLTSFLHGFRSFG